MSVIYPVTKAEFNTIKRMLERKDTWKEISTSTGRSPGTIAAIRHATQFSDYWQSQRVRNRKRYLASKGPGSLVKTRYFPPDRSFVLTEPEFLEIKRLYLEE